MDIFMLIRTDSNIVCYVIYLFSRLIVDKSSEDNVCDLF